MTNDNFFDNQGTDFPWKTKKYWFCQTPGMSLWIALHCIESYIHEDKDMEREAHKKAIRSWPYEANDCKCKDCRYFRLTKKKN